MGCTCTWALSRATPPSHHTQGHTSHHRADQRNRHRRAQIHQCQASAHGRPASSQPAAARMSLFKSLRTSLGSALAGKRIIHWPMGSTRYQ